MDYIKLRIIFKIQIGFAVSVAKANHIMLQTEVIAVCLEIHEKRINVLCVSNVEFLNVKPCDAYKTTGI